MADDSYRKRILAALRDRVAEITPENGFSTEAGRHIFIGALPQLGENDPDAAIAIAPEDLEPTYQGEHVRGEWPIAVIAVANASANRDDPWMVVEDVLADIQRAVELPDRFLDGLCRHHFRCGTTRTYPRETGSESVAVAQTYLFPVVRVWGHPESR